MTADFTRDEVLEALSYNPETGVFVWNNPDPRTKMKSGDVAGGYCPQGYWRVFFRGKHRPCHRLAWLIVHGRWPVDFIDHINGIRSDNRICNLREANNSLNSGNRRGLGQYLKGVTRDPKYGKFRASIKKDGKNYHLGCFVTEMEAHQAYCRKAIELFGEFARAA